jgi:glycosyltransferase involved in cell wall biosynthesis
MKRPHVLFVAPSLDVGGAEYVMVSLADGLREHASVRFALVRPFGSLVDQLSEPPILLGGRLRWIPTLLRAIHKSPPDAVMASAWDINLGLMAARPWFPSRTRLVIREPVSVRLAMAEKFWRQPLKGTYFRLYAKADAIVALSQKIAHEIVGEVPAMTSRLVTIPNAPPLWRLPPLPSPGQRWHGGKLRCVALGRLTHQKGYDQLIGSVALVRQKGLDATLTIFGEGPDRAMLEALATARDVAQHVALPGRLDDLAHLQDGDLFVLSSRFEGLPNALIEALCAGVPALAAVHGTAADEIVKDGIDGWLVEGCSESELAAGLMRAVITLPGMDRRALAEQARERFSHATMVARYRTALLDLRYEPGS